jgi:NADH:ubiquinone oxidoreductase subunit F (NADH-binding)
VTNPVCRSSGKIRRVASAEIEMRTEMKKVIEEIWPGMNKK